MVQYRLYRHIPPLAARWQKLDMAWPEADPQAVESIRSTIQHSFAHLTQPLDEFDRELSDLAEGRFTFLNRTRAIDPVDWNRRYESHLWNYQLHYFGFAVPAARALAERGDAKPWRRCRGLIESWIETARLGWSDGWDPYPISLRAVNWIYAYSLVDGKETEREFLRRWSASIYQQVLFLASHPEVHLRANHLLKNVRALLVANVFFGRDHSFPGSVVLLIHQLVEQQLADGGHYERAPMYHAQALADFLECYAFVRESGEFPDLHKLDARLRGVARFLKAMSYPDGALSLFNDSANARETRPAPILDTAERLLGRDETPFVTAFPETGYYLWQSPDETEKIIVDAGPPAVEFNMAHAHCDMLSYELRLQGKPFVVDAGVHGYGGDRFREYCRSTRAHNTVMFDGVEQSELWGTFRVARCAELLNVEVNGDGPLWDFWGECLRYDRALVHERHIRREANGDWMILDVAREGRAERARSFIHLHPAIEARLSSELIIECRIGARVVLIEPFNVEKVEIVRGADDPLQGWHFPDFGVAQPCATILLDYRVKVGESFGYRIRKID
jgi:hypothetical protein